jgi:hypothetical protein
VQNGEAEEDHHDEVAERQDDEVAEAQGDEAAKVQDAPYTGILVSIATSHSSVLDTCT